MLTAQSENLMPCLVGSEPGPWKYRLELRNAEVQSALLVADGADATPRVTTLTTCVEEVLRSLRFRQLGQSIEVRVSRRQAFGVAHGGIGGGIGAVNSGSTRSPPNAGVGSRVHRTPRVRPGSLNVRGGLPADVVLVRYSFALTPPR